MRRGVIFAAVVGVLVVAGLGLWLALFRDTAEPVSVAEAVTSFRTDTEPEPGASSPIRAGVYVYATDGVEKTDALTGVTHRYPRRSTVAVTAADCGMSLTWRVLRGRSTEWVLCVTDDGWLLRSQDERHTFFGRTEATTYTCEGSPIRPQAYPSGRWAVTCSTGTVEERGSAELVARGFARVGSTRVPVEHVRRTTTFTGATRGTSTQDWWFDSASGVPVRIVLVSHTTNDSPIGAVHYDEDVTLRLLSLEPRR
jgi:hypothetical protein